MKPPQPAPVRVVVDPKKPSGRISTCKKCGFDGTRTRVRASNILSRRLSGELSKGRGSINNGSSPVLSAESVVMPTRVQGTRVKEKPPLFTALLPCWPAPAGQQGSRGRACGVSPLTHSRCELCGSDAVHRHPSEVRITGHESGLQASIIDP